MANPLKGEVALSVGEATYTLLFDINALGEVEDLLNEPAQLIVLRLARPPVRIKTLKALLWGALREHHPEVDMKGCGRLIQEATFPVVEQAIAEALRRSFPAAEEAEGAEDPQTAAKAADGSGNASSNSGAS